MTWIHPELKEYFLGYELLKRFASHSHGRAQPFWYFIPVFMIGFLPWFFFLPGMVYRLWSGGRGKRPLGPALWLLLGWIVPPFLILSLSGSKLLTYLLPLFPAFALGMTYGWFRLGYNLRTLAITCGSSIVILLLTFSQADRLNGYFGKQASVRTLAQHIHRLSSDSPPTVFASDVRTHGLEFYLGNMVSVTRTEADLVLGTDPEQEKRLFDSALKLEEKFTGKANTYGIVRNENFVKYFQNSGWEILEKAGDFMLIAPHLEGHE
jgi:hypothetical protein